MLPLSSSRYRLEWYEYLPWFNKHRQDWNHSELKLEVDFWRSVLLSSPRKVRQWSLMWSSILSSRTLSSQHSNTQLKMIPPLLVASCHMHAVVTIETFGTEEMSSSSSGDEAMVTGRNKLWRGKISEQICHRSSEKDWSGRKVLPYILKGHVISWCILLAMYM